MKKHRGLKIFGIILAAIVLFWVIINVFPPLKNVEKSRFFMF